MWVRADLLNIRPETVLIRDVEELERIIGAALWLMVDGNLAFICVFTSFVMCYFTVHLRFFVIIVHLCLSDIQILVILSFWHIIFEFRFCEHLKDTQLESKRHNFIWNEQVSRFFGILNTSHTFFGIEGVGVCLRMCVCSDFFPYISPICLMKPDFRLGLGHGFENFWVFWLTFIMCSFLFIYLYMIFGFWAEYIWETPMF